MKKLAVSLFAALLCVTFLPVQADDTPSPAQTPAKTTAKKGDKKPAGAKTPGGAPKYDTHLPIEISSDNLEVLQKENKAIFRGNVIAVQGQLRLNSDKMTVHYKQKDQKNADGTPAPKPVPAPGAPAQGGEMGAISLIEVEGHVIMVSPEESATGDQGYYDTEKRFLHLTGETVVLTRGQNILRGKAADYNLDTGRSILTTGDAKQTGKGDNRVRGVFIPTPKDDGKKKPDAPADAQPDAKAHSKPNAEQN